jgi:hypothetical protein
MTNDQLWAVIFLACGAVAAWHAYTSANSGKWTWPLYHLTVDHRTSPMGYWICISWDLMGMIFMFALAAFSLTR